MLSSFGNNSLLYDLLILASFLGYVKVKELTSRGKKPRYSLKIKKKIIKRKEKKNNACGMQLARSFDLSRQRIKNKMIIELRRSIEKHRYRTKISRVDKI